MLHVGYWWESQKERDHWENQDVGGCTILKWILERWDGMDWIDLAQVDGSCEHGDEPSDSLNVGKFLSCCTICSFSGRAQLLK
jgi:hypothetical protein